MAPKVLPYAAVKTTRIFHALANVSCCVLLTPVALSLQYLKIAKDQEPTEKAQFNELWEDEGEPVSQLQLFKKRSLTLLLFCLC